MCDVAFNTALKLLPENGRACAKYQNYVFRNVLCRRIQRDEFWSFCYAKTSSPKKVPHLMACPNPK
jgi:hypothetical protein